MPSRPSSKTLSYTPSRGRSPSNRWRSKSPYKLKETKIISLVELSAYRMRAADRSIDLECSIKTAHLTRCKFRFVFLNLAFRRKKSLVIRIYLLFRDYEHRSEIFTVHLKRNEKSNKPAFEWRSCDLWSGLCRHFQAPGPSCCLRNRADCCRNRHRLKKNSQFIN